MTAEQKIQYATLILYHNIKNSDEERKIKKMIEKQEKKELQQPFLRKSTTDSWNLGDWNRQNQHGKNKWKRKSYQRLKRKWLKRWHEEQNVEQ